MLYNMTILIQSKLILLILQFLQQANVILIIKLRIFIQIYKLNTEILMMNFLSKKWRFVI